MKIKITDSILSYEGKPMLEKVEDKERPITWRAVVFMALNNFPQGEQPTNELKSKCFQISVKVHASDEPDLTVDERATIIDRIDKFYTHPLICGRAKEFFEEKKEEIVNPMAEPKKEEKK